MIYLALGLTVPCSEHSITGGISEDQSRGGESPPVSLLVMFLVMQLRIWLAFWAASTHIEFFIKENLWSPSSQGCFSSVLHCSCTLECPNQDTGPCTWPCWIMSFIQVHLSRLPSPLCGTSPFPYDNCNMQLGNHQQTCWRCIQSYSPCH